MHLRVRLALIGVSLVLSVTGLLFGCNQSPEERLAECERKLLADPTDVSTHVRRGDLLLGLDRFGEAAEAYDRAIDLRPDAVEVYARRAAARIEAGGMFAAALSDLDRAVEAGLADGPLQCLRGRALERLGRRDEALIAYTRAADLEAGAPSPYVLAGDLLRRMERHEEAIQAYRKALDRRARSPGDVYMSMGLSLWLLDRDDEGLEAFERAAEFEPSALRATRMQGQLFEEAGRFEEALEAYTRICGVHPVDPIGATRRAAILERLGRAEEALDAYDRYLELVPDAFVARMARDKLAERMGRAPR